MYIKGFAYHLEVCGKELSESQEDSNESFRKSASDDSESSGEDVKISILPCTMVM